MQKSDAMPMTARNRVPEITVSFWVVKLLAVTVGETAADYLSDNLGLGLANTSYIMTGVLLLELFLQFAQIRYVHWIYWLAVVFISVVGTLITDNLSDGLGVALLTSTVAFTLALVATFAVWYGFEKTLSIHTIYTFRREAFYWLAILFTFSLGTATGAWLAETLGLGYVETGLLFAGVIVAVAVAYYVFKIDSILAFWIAYIFTRPLGASFGDLLSQPKEDGGLGLGTTVTSLAFLGCIAVVVVYMTLRRGGVETAGPAAGSTPRLGNPKNDSLA
jgi:uncharacterized membrane-anchored protein